AIAEGQLVASAEKLKVPQLQALAFELVLADCAYEQWSNSAKALWRETCAALKVDLKAFEKQAKDEQKAKEKAEAKADEPSAPKKGAKAKTPAEDDAGDDVPEFDDDI
ncbi:MAG: hypothetical protein ACK4N5_07935, partial [Myxococcales bacterium]